MNDFSSKPVILVTGGLGYIGSHTTVELLQAGYEVVLVDDLSNSYLPVLDNIEKITGKRPLLGQFDLCDKAELTDFLADKRVDVVLHFAARLFVEESVQKPLLYYRNNLVSLLNLLEVMQAREITRFVFSSSCSVYGVAKKLPMTEETPLGEPNCPYARTKLMSEQILQDTVQSDLVNQSKNHLQAIALRYFNPIGAHASGLIGEHGKMPPTHLVPVMTETAIGKREKMYVYGNDYNTPDGSCVRDYIHVVDLAQAHVKAVEHLLQQKNKTPFEVFNVGTGHGYSVLEMITTFEKVTGKKIPYEIKPRRAGDVPAIYADCTKANQELGWHAEKTLKDMLLSAWQWEQKLKSTV